MSLRRAQPRKGLGAGDTSGHGAETSCPSGPSGELGFRRGLQPGPWGPALNPFSACSPPARRRGRLGGAKLAPPARGGRTAGGGV